LVITGILGGTAIAAPPSPVLQSLWWTAKGAETDAGTTKPSACLAFKTQDSDRVKAGMALFNTPSLLGGQAAKAGLNCGSCHDNGRDNPHFHVDGLSGAAGTADVTSSFFSAVRGNAVHDPVAIPDLAKPGKISRAANDPALELFIRTLIVEEFAGKEPKPSTLSALAAYVRAIRICDSEQKTDRRVSDPLELIDAAVDGALAMHRSGENETALILVRAARHQLGLIHERYSASRFNVERSALLDSSRQLQDIADNQDLNNFGPLLVRWRDHFNAGLVPRLRAGERYSLYNRRKLRSALNETRRGKF
jgi:hypothetical protein